MFLIIAADVPINVLSVLKYMMKQRSLYCQLCKQIKINGYFCRFPPPSPQYDIWRGEEAERKISKEQHYFLI